MGRRAKGTFARSWDHAVAGVGGAVVVAFLLIALFESAAQAHKAVTSKYTYNEHVFPIFRDRCGSCHIDGGPTPMSLLTYKEAVPWAESIRQELTTEKMPPWYVDSTGPAIKGGHVISVREIDTILTWATGGTPEGAADKAPAPRTSHPQWQIGSPDLTLQMDAAYTVAADTSEETRDFLLPTHITDAKWVKAADLLPGMPSAVRDALVSIENGPVLATWIAGEDAIAAPSGAAFRLPAGAAIHLQIHYKKRWQDERAELTDRSTVGLYFTDAPILGRDIKSVAIDGPAAGAAPESRAFGGALSSDARVIAVRPSFDRPYGSATVRAVLPSGRRVALLELRAPRPEWRRRYWLADPVELPAGSRIEVSLGPSTVMAPDTRPSKGFPLQIALDYVPQ